MTDWNNELQKARIEHPDPFSDPARIRKGRGWKKQTPVRVPPALEDVMGSIYTSRELNRKSSAPERVMNRAMEYHAVEVGKRHAKHVARIKDPNRFNLLLFLLLPSVCCGSVWLFSQIALAR